MNPLPHSLTRSLVIAAPRAVVFRYFTDSERFARWWGPGSTIEGRVGGTMKIAYPNGVVARGEVMLLEPDRRIAFTYGYEHAHPELPPGSSLVTIELDDVPGGTRLSFRHDLPAAKSRDEHVPGWRFHLAVFAVVVADEHHRDAEAVVDRFFGAWAETDPARRAAGLAACTTDGVSHHDRYSNLVGRDELHGHIGNTQRHLPGVVLRRDGPVQHCQGRLLVAWRADGPGGAAQFSGRDFVQLAPDGRIAAVVGFW